MAFTILTSDTTINREEILYIYMALSKVLYFQMNIIGGHVIKLAKYQFKMNTFKPFQIGNLLSTNNQHEMTISLQLHS